MRVLDGGLKDGIPLKLRYNARSQSGYRDVVPNGDCATNGGRRPWKVQWLDKYGGAVPGIGRREYLGSYATAEEAAIALARRVQQREAEGPRRLRPSTSRRPRPKSSPRNKKSPSMPPAPATTRSTPRQRGWAPGEEEAAAARGGDRRCGSDDADDDRQARRRTARQESGAGAADRGGVERRQRRRAAARRRAWRRRGAAGHPITRAATRADEMIGTMGAEEALAAAAAEGLTLWRSNNVSGYRAVYHQKNVNAANGGIFEVRTKEGDNMISHHGYFRTAEHAALVFARYVRDERGEAGETRPRGWAGCLSPR